MKQKELGVGNISVYMPAQSEEKLKILRKVTRVWTNKKPAARKKLYLGAFGILKNDIPEKVSSVAYVNKLRKSWGRVL